MEYLRYERDARLCNPHGRKFTAAGERVLHIAKESPGGGLESNWLPAPIGPFYMVLRLYGPEPAALEGKWTPPGLRKAE